jgi:ABC-type multidrug transport system ATPase subunit
MGQVVLEVRDLRHSVGDKPLLDGLSFRLETGGVTALIGPPGSGKTTLLRILGGLLPLQEGSAAIDGTEITEPASRRETGMLVDEPALWGELSVAGNLEMQGRLLGTADRRRMGKLMKALEILPRNIGSRRAGGCPESIKLRLGAAMALLGSPRLLLLDNVFAGLDSDDALRLRKLLQEEMAERAMAVLLTGSYFPALWEAAGEFLRLEEGKIRAHYRKEDLLPRLSEAPGGPELESLWEELGKEAGI